MKLDALLRAHAFMQVERPPELWEADADDQTLIPLLGEMIAASLARSGGLDLKALALNASNVIVPEETGPVPPPGEYVAITIRGKVEWGTDASWLPDKPWNLPDLADLTGRLAPAGVRYAYIRSTGSITAFLPRKT